MVFDTQWSTPMKRYWAYLKYLINHKYNVFVAGFVLNVPILRLILHDISKFRPYEFVAYARAFYDRDGKPQRSYSYEFNYAWLDHQKRNKHHWQAWVILDDKGLSTPLPIPNTYVREMLADFMAMALNPNSRSVLEYYESIKHNHILHPETQDTFEELCKEYLYDIQIISRH